MQLPPWVNLRNGLIGALAAPVGYGVYRGGKALYEYYNEPSAEEKAARKKSAAKAAKTRAAKKAAETRAANARKAKHARKKSQPVKGTASVLRQNALLQRQNKALEGLLAAVARKEKADAKKAKATKISHSAKPSAKKAA